MKITFVGKENCESGNFKEVLEKYNFKYVDENPDVVFCYGGDGMFLIAERKFPGVPKILLRNSKICNQCCDFDFEDAIRLYKSGDYKLQEIRKLEAVYRGRFETRKLVGVNDIVLRNTLPTEAIRFKVKINGRDLEKEFIGDGVVVATAYGSTKGAYFYSITGKEFSEGIGFAFNNVTAKTEPIFLNSDGEIEIEIMRGPGVLVADNNRDFINLEKGDRIVIKLTENIARRIILG